MAGRSNSKLRCLLLMRVLMDRTDEENPLSAIELENIIMNQYHQEVSRKTIYDDIEILRESGLVIAQKKGRYAGYYVEKRDFSLPELKLLVDAVQSTNFITKKKSEELIRKLGNLTSVGQAKMLRREVFLLNRPKTKNEDIYNIVDVIHSAIFYNRQIEFRYTYWTEKKVLEYKKNGKRYQVSPWSLCWDDENYYLVAYDITEDKMKHFRVDKIRETRILEEARKGRECFGNNDLATYVKKTFGMYGGIDHFVTFRCKNHLAGALIDRFGEDVMMIPLGMGEFRVHAQVTVSPQFYGWVTGIGSDMIIEGPDSVKQDYEKYLKEILQQYK